MAEIFVGEVAVGVVPDARGWETKLRSQLVPSSNNIGREMGKQMTQGIAQDLNVGRAVSTSADKGAADSARAGDKSAGAFAIAFRKRLEAALKNLPEAKIDADSSKADVKIAEIRSKMAELGSKQIGVDISAKDALIQLRILEMQLNEVRKGADIPVRMNVDKARAEIHKLRSDMDGLAKQNVFDKIAASITNISGRTGQMSLFSKIWLGINLATSTLEPTMASLSVVVMGLAAGLSSAALGLGAFGIAAVGVFGKAFQGASAYLKAQQQVNAATTSAQRQAALHKEQVALEGMTGAQKQFTMSLVGVHKEWDKWIAKISPGMIHSVSGAFGLIPPILHTIGEFLKPMESAMQVIILDIHQGLISSGFQNFVHDMAAGSGVMFIRTWNIIKNILIGVGGLLHAFLPYAQQMMGGLQGLTARFAQWGQSMGPSHSGFKSLITMFKQDGPLLGQLLKNLMVIIKELLGAMAGSTVIGNSHMFVQLLTDLSGVLKVLMSNQYFSLLLVYSLALHSYWSKLAAVGGPVVNSIRGFANATKGMSGDLGPAGKVGAGLRNLVSGMRSSEAAASATTGVMGTLGGAIMHPVTAFRSMVGAIREWTIWAKVQAAWSKVVAAGQWLINAAMDANPIALVVIAIVALIAIFVVLWLKSSAFRKFWIGIWNDILGIVKGVWHWLQHNWPLVLAILTGPIGLATLFIIKHWDDIKHAFVVVRDFLQHAWDVVVKVWTTVFGVIKGLWNGMISGMRTAMTTLWNWLKTIFDPISKAWGTAYNAAKNAMKAPLKWLIQVVWNPFANMVDRFTSFLHLGRPVPTINASSWQTGGRIPGYGGGDTVPAYLERGEAVVPKHLAGDPFFSAWAGGHGIPGYQLGGLIGAVGHIASRAFHGLEHLVGGLLVDAAKPVAHALLNALGKIPGGDNKGDWGGMLAAYPRWAIDKFLSWLTKKDEAFGVAGWPFPTKSMSQLRRVDEGQDMQYPGTSVVPIHAILPGRVMILGPDPSGFGNAYPGQVLDSPVMGFKSIYYGHVYPLAGIGGKHVAAGTVIAHTGGTTSGGDAAGLSNWLELGFMPISWANGPAMHRLLTGGGAGGAVPGNISGVVAMGRSMAAARGWTGGEWTALYNLWMKESGWNPNARNPSSGAAGIPQDITGNFHGGARGQIAWGLNYIAGRYGTPWWAWQHEVRNNWYDAGGMWPHGTTGVNMSGSPEAVLTSGQWDVMYSIGRAAQQGAARGGDGAAAVEYHAHFDGLTRQSIQSEVRTAFRQMEAQAGWNYRMGRRR